MNFHRRELSADPLGEWGSRSEFWHDFSSTIEPRRPKRQRRDSPLVLSGFGVSLRVENGTLLIRNGFTHYPQQREEFQFFKGQLDVPERITMLDGNGSFSFSVIDWLREHNVVLVRIGWDGKSTVAFGSSGSPTNGEKLKWQFDLEQNPRKRMDFGARLICEKLSASQNTLLANFPNSETREKAIAKIADGHARLAKGGYNSINEILTIEGQCASGYFDVWRGLELRWSGLGRRPIPATWRVYDQRSSILTGKKPENYKAAHPINAMLNYGYAVLEAETRIRLVAEGYDPRIGILHIGRKRGKEDSFVFDMMEPLRPVVDAAVLDLADRHTFSSVDFVLRKDGVCRLSPQLAKVVTSSVSRRMKTETRLGND